MTGNERSRDPVVPLAVMSLATVAIVIVLCWQQPAKTATNRIVYAQHNLNVTSFAAQTRFWSGMLGAVTIESPDPKVAILSFPNLIIFMRENPPHGGTAGSSVDHVGFQVPSVRDVVERLEAAGYPIVQGGHALPARGGPTSIAFDRDLRANVAFVMAPDALNVELIENAAIKTPTFHHVHFVTPAVDTMQKWYAGVFHAEAARQGSIAADRLPLGVSLLFSPTASQISGTHGRVIDHIGFEVSDLKEFCTETETRGVTLDQGYRIVPAPWNSHSAILTDPAGTSIQVTQGAAFGFFRRFVGRD